jgi:hypothetical protein
MTSVGIAWLNDLVLHGDGDLMGKLFLRLDNRIVDLMPACLETHLQHVLTAAVVCCTGWLDALLPIRLTAI